MKKDSFNVVHICVQDLRHAQVLNDRLCLNQAATLVQPDDTNDSYQRQSELNVSDDSRLSP